MTRWQTAVALLEEQPPRRGPGDRWPLGRDVVEVIRRLVHALDLTSLIEFGPGASTARLSDLPLTSWVAIEHDAEFFEKLRRRLKASGDPSHVHAHLVPIVWCRRGPYFGRGYRLPDLNVTFDLAVVDGPPARTVGRLMTLPLLWPYLRRGAFLLLDDSNREKTEGRVLRAWEQAYGDAIRLRRFRHFAKGLALIQKVRAEASPRAWPAALASAGECLAVSRSAPRSLIAAFNRSRPSRSKPPSH